MRYFYCFLILLSFANVGLAYDPVIVNCIETPGLPTETNEKPAKFNHINNLIRKPGSPLRAEGELIYITGRVTDINCLPIQNAVIHIWQADASGKYTMGDKKTKDPYFIGSGTFITDNLGNYGFVSIKPASIGEHPPQINFSVLHPDFIDLETRMFFADFKDNTVDSNLTKFVDADLQNLLVAPFSLNTEGTKVYRFNITLGSKNKYAKY